MFSCSHTTAKVRLKQALDELGTGGAAALAAELSRLDNEIHLLDHRKGEAEKAVARALEGAQRAAGWGGTDEDLAAAGREVQELELIHDEYVEIVGALRDRVVAELDRLVGQAGPDRSPRAEDAYA